ncbi:MULTISPECIES: zinc transporter ZupT [unclassified Fusibacter]|uniref:zinc transporter ZupT n=1 Tax=unclassified Fusibacter TaxID=2624464 RepID=UPI00101069A2|nr:MULTISPECIES: zinc transporter ZupT [unclassified Fusibacter]MCK8060605.1 zinc transporter ZupT [Fusibacter sp. A2]NPE22941.1 zinc transporter ZupT [Fusibacter sp. A1]RXV60008.1 zinc transporter ZupT [Fusibacter sp. A1]
MNNVWFAFGLTIFAGLSTGIGSMLAFYTKQTNKKFLSGSLGFSAGVMIYVSFIEIFPKAKDSLSIAVGPRLGYLYTTLAFFAGIALIALIDKFVPSFENPHEMMDVNDMQNDEGNNKALMRMGLFSALAIGIHNFPEGLATFIAALEDPALGVSIAVAIAIHNIPEGIAVSVPIYFATGDKKKAFFYSFLSGLSEPIGALLGYFLLMRYFNDMMFGLVFASVAGIMVYISLDELLPTAEKYGHHHIAIWGVISGMVVMAASLLLFV